MLGVLAALDHDLGRMMQVVPIESFLIYPMVQV